MTFTVGRRIAMALAIELVMDEHADRKGVGHHARNLAIEREGEIRDFELPRSSPIEILLVVRFGVEKRDARLGHKPECARHCAPMQGGNFRNWLGKCLPKQE